MAVDYRRRGGRHFTSAAAAKTSKFVLWSVAAAASVLLLVQNNSHSGVGVVAAFSLPQYAASSFAHHRQALPLSAGRNGGRLPVLAAVSNSDADSVAGDGTECNDQPAADASIIIGSDLGPSSQLSLSSTSSLRTAVVASALFASIVLGDIGSCLLYTSPSPRDKRQSRMPSSA